jgi:hypothetical protein
MSRRLSAAEIVTERVKQLEKDHNDIVEGLKNELDDVVIEQNTRNDEAAAVTAKQEEQTKTKSLQSAIKAINTDRNNG